MAKQVDKMEMAEQFRLDIQPGANCTDPDCASFNKESHPCEFTVNDQTCDGDATVTVTEDDIAVYFFCNKCAPEFVKDVLQEWTEEAKAS